MNKKICAKCGVEKDTSEFMPKKNGKLHSWCNDCRLSYNKEWRIKNAEHVNQYKMDNKERDDAYDKKYREEHREEIKITASKYNESHKEEHREYWSKHKDRTRERRREWCDKNRDKYNEYFIKYYKDEERKIAHNLRTRIRFALKGEVKLFTLGDVLGCTIEELKSHLESQFTEGMDWDDYGVGRGKWGIDHILPCDAFDMTDPFHQRACFNWRNLRPLWAVENTRKHANYNQDEFDEYLKWFRTYENILKTA